MLTPGRLAAALLSTLLLSGCAFDSLWNDVPAGRGPLASSAPGGSPSSTPAAQQDERGAHPYTGALATGATCTRVDAELLDELETAGNVGGAITYPVGAMVKANAKWWAIAVATAVDPYSDGYSRESVPRYEVFVSNSPSYDLDELGPDLFTWKLGATAGDPAATKAIACAKRLPVPKPQAPPPPWASYTGKVARSARCIPLSDAQLRHFQDVGQVGGAITYPRGFRVKANLKWWTVAVATQVNPNSQGYTTDNVPATELFVSNAPTSSSGLSFPVKERKSDAAARKALACLRG